MREISIIDVPGIPMNIFIDIICDAINNEIEFKNVKDWGCGSRLLRHLRKCICWHFKDLKLNEKFLIKLY
jgi:hypothetical protein